MKGIAASPGVAFGHAVVLQRREFLSSGAQPDGETGRLEEKSKFDHAVRQSVREIEILKSTITHKEGVDILEAHIELLTDPEIRNAVILKIDEDKLDANDAVVEVIRETVNRFRAIQDVYLSARAADIADIGDRILRHLSGNARDIPELEPNSIIIADDLSPSEILLIDMQFVNGFALETGGKTSHAAIIAKSRGIPAVVGCTNLLKVIHDRDELALDGSLGELVSNPNEEVLRDFRKRRDKFLEYMEVLKSVKDMPTSTTDGITVSLMANISGPDDLNRALDYGAEGIGLLRTEMLFLSRTDFPSEEEQFQFYLSAAFKAGSFPVTIRTMDIGGDKHLPYFNLPPEQNPSLGYRGIRISLDRKEMFVSQLRAILRASVAGKVKIMFPMISEIGEVRVAKAILEEVRQSLRREKIDFDEQVKVGIMIEVPSAALIADLLADEVDFFSIGTNDLCQYTMAVDRMNEQVKALYDWFHPGLLRLVRKVIDAGHRHGIPVSLCGEMASDPLATPLLLGMGLREFSMSPPAIPVIKSGILQTNMEEAENIFHRVMTLSSAGEIKAYLAKNIK